MKFISKIAPLLFSTCCTLWLPVSRQQVTALQTSQTGLCHVSVEDLRVLPSSGFTRSILEPYNTTLASAPIPALAESAGCLLQSYGVYSARLPARAVSRPHQGGQGAGLKRHLRLEWVGAARRLGL